MYFESKAKEVLKSSDTKSGLNNAFIGLLYFSFLERLFVFCKLWSVKTLHLCIFHGHSNSPWFSFSFMLIFEVIRLLNALVFQDLPNYAQHTVPIFSLPQEWLWCESWCGNATKSKAKTIDLCNNPMTKEPKLQVNACSLSCAPSFSKQLNHIIIKRGLSFFFFFVCTFSFRFYQLQLWFSQGARRIVSEWPDLDLEARRFTAKIIGDDEVDLQEPSSNQPESSTRDSSSEEDLESKSELWI
jgi:hypothetical protein